MQGPLRVGTMKGCGSLNPSQQTVLMEHLCAKPHCTTVRHCCTGTEPWLTTEKLPHTYCCRHQVEAACPHQCESKQGRNPWTPSLASLSSPFIWDMFSLHGLCWSWTPASSSELLRFCLGLPFEILSEGFGALSNIFPYCFGDSAPPFLENSLIILANAFWTVHHCVCYWNFMSVLSLVLLTPDIIIYASFFSSFAFY